MHLEKVTSRSSEAGLAGWIASNDVTLFTVVLVMVIAIFLHSRVTMGNRQREELADEKASLSATLASTQSDLDSAADLLDRTQSQLKLTNEERDQLRKQLVEKLAALAELNARLEALLAEKGALESQRQTLIAATQSLSAEKNTLLSEQATLTKDLASLRDRLDSLTQRLAEKVAALEELEKQRDRLKRQADELDDIVASLKRKLEEMNVDLVDARDDAQAALVASNEKVEKLEAQVAAGDKQAEEYLAQLKRAAAMLESLKAEKRALETSITEAERQRQAALEEEARNYRELIGLKGPLRRVAIVLDASGSMKEAGSRGEDRWAEVQEIAGTWLQHLNVEECVLIVYSSRVRTFPEDGTMASFRGAEGHVRREALLQNLKSITPGGWTNTYEGMRKAYEYNVDTIVLFTDGAPSRAASGAYDEALARQIFALCRQNAGVPINTVGLGNYFDANMSTFLKTVASLTGGTFRGE
jgi:septal ring factor EnvC (AmiA/AmiB activator)